MSNVDEVASHPRDQVLQTPVTPVTPVTSAALDLLHDLIKEEACTLNEPSKQRIQRHVQKLASAAQISFAKQVLLQDQNRFLSKVNNEAEVRRSIRSVVLGKAKVMSYEDLEEAWAKRAVKEKATMDKRRSKSRGRTRKRPALMKGPSVSTFNEVPEPIEAPAPCRAPVARMY